MKLFGEKKFLLSLAIPFAGLTLCSVVWADAGPDPADDSGGDMASSAAEPAGTQAPAQSLGQFPQAEITTVSQTQTVSSPSAPAASFPKVKTREDEGMARRFAWWPSDAQPAPVKDSGRSGYWWWPQSPGQTRPWGNQGYVYVRKVIFDYKSAEGEMRPSLVIKKVIRNVKVFFDFDKSGLREDARDVLSKAVYTLERNLKADILVTGNADVRGSEQHNFKLAEKRAEAVKGFLLEGGIPEDRIRILSRGKLDALAPPHDIIGMQKDRNAQFMIAEVEEVMIPASQASRFEDQGQIEERQELEGEVKVGFKDYVVQGGDTLWGIAKREYGDGSQWKRIYEFNRDVISNPNKPRKGTKIRIPIE